MSDHQPSPDCRDEKHRSCFGGGWDLDTDTPIPCPCSCHGGTR